MYVRCCTLIYPLPRRFVISYSALRAPSPGAVRLEGAVYAVDRRYAGSYGGRVRVADATRPRAAAAARIRKTSAWPDTFPTFDTGQRDRSQLSGVTQV